MRASWCTGLILTYLAVACGGSGGEPAEPAGRGQAVVCDDLCLRLNDCARADALERAPETLATRDGVSGEQLLERNLEQCVSQCNGGVMPPAQQRAVDRCFAIEACAPFVDCVEPLL